MFLKTSFREVYWRMLAGRPVGGLPVERIRAERGLRPTVCPARQGQCDVAPDGRFLINTVLHSAAAPITLIQNWNPEAT